MENTNNKVSATREISIRELIDIALKYYKYLLGKWKIIVIFSIVGAGIGLAASFIIKPTYTANLSFALVEKSSGGGGLADLASSFGFGGLMGGNQSAFSGDNLLEIMKSRHVIEQTLLTPVNYKGKNVTLAEVYISFKGLRDKWESNKANKDLFNCNFPIDSDRKKFNRTQDSVLYDIYGTLSDGKYLQIVRKDKKLSFVSLNFTSKDELFSKLFVETLMDQTYRFYKETKTKQSNINILMMQQKADSVKALYESAMYKGASLSAVNINPAIQLAAVPRLKQESDARLYGTVYTEILKNLETLKLDLARETPIVQVIDSPVMPLKKDKIGKIKGVVLGGILFGFLTAFFLLIRIVFTKNQL